MVITRFPRNIFNINTMTSDLNRCDFELFTWEIALYILDYDYKGNRCTNYFYQINRCMDFHYLYLGNGHFKRFVK